MLNANKLRGKIAENNMSISEMSHILGIAPSTFYRKIKNNSFEIGEADKIVHVLSLSAKDANDIFFSQLVA